MVKYQDVEDLKLNDLLLSSDFKINEINNTVKKNQVGQVYKLYKDVINSFDNRKVNYREYFNNKN